MLARMMRFYGMQPSEYDALTRTRHRHLVQLMEHAQRG